jgi:hypothetical protein
MISCSPSFLLATSTAWGADECVTLLRVRAGWRRSKRRFPSIATFKGRFARQDGPARSSHRSVASQWVERCDGCCGSNLGLRAVPLARLLSRITAQVVAVQRLYDSCLYRREQTQPSQQTAGRNHLIGACGRKASGMAPFQPTYGVLRFLS